MHCKLNSIPCGFDLFIIVTLSVHLSRNHQLCFVVRFLGFRCPIIFCMVVVTQDTCLRIISSIKGCTTMILCVCRACPFFELLLMEYRLPTLKRIGYWPNHKQFPPQALLIEFDNGFVQKFLIILWSHSSLDNNVNHYPQQDLIGRVWVFIHMKSFGTHIMDFMHFTLEFI